MDPPKVLFAVISLLGILAGRAGAETIELFTFPSPPYQVVHEIPGPLNQIHGLTIDTLSCVLNKMGFKTRIHAAPQKRGIQFLLDDLVDGYFAVDPSSSLDRFAFRTDPVSLEKWHLVARDEPNLPETPRIGAVDGSNEAAWLASQNKPVFLTVRTPQQLIALLHRRRIDQALMDQRVLASMSDTDGLTSKFLRYVPLHAYFGRRFIDRNPEFIGAFNQRLPLCLQTNFELDLEELARIRATAYDLFKDLEGLISMPDAIEKGPHIKNLSEILNLDKQWQALAPLNHTELAKEVAGQSASRIMAEWQSALQPLVTEVMLTNSIGTLVAMSRLTSDFWQGDEPKFERHIRGHSRDLYVSPIRFDASTGRFQITVSMPILAAGRWLPLGVLVIGLDVEQALASDPRVRYLSSKED